jgi:hypothetical protein
MMSDGELWHVVEAKRDDGMPTMFRIREINRQPQLTKIFVVELPYPRTELSRLPAASDYRRLAEFEEKWLGPACHSLGWEVVGHKTEDGSFFVYMYGCTDPTAMIEKLSPFDTALGFYDDDDPDWQEYGTLKDLLDQAKAIPQSEPSAAAMTAPAKRSATADKGTANGAKRAAATTKATPAKRAAAANAKAPAKRAAAAKAKAKPTKRAVAKRAAATPKAKGKSKAKPTAKTKSKAKPSKRR